MTTETTETNEPTAHPRKAGADGRGSRVVVPSFILALLTTPLIHLALAALYLAALRLVGELTGAPDHGHLDTMRMVLAFGKVLLIGPFMAWPVYLAVYVICGGAAGLLAALLYHGFRWAEAWWVFPLVALAASLGTLPVAALAAEAFLGGHPRDLASLTATIGLGLAPVLGLIFGQIYAWHVPIARKRDAAGSPIPPRDPQ